jgi:hypothetical protein
MKRCKLCKKPEKNHGKQCGFEDILYNLNPENYPVIDGNPLKVVACPYCARLWSKLDEKGCDHMICKNCNHEFTFCCMARRSPTMEHGAHYHRLSCPHVQRDADIIKQHKEGHKEDKYKEKCGECVKLKKLCPRPPELYKGVFPPEVLDLY